LSCLLKEQLLEPALNLTVHCCGLDFRVLNGYDQKSFDEERGLKRHFNRHLLLLWCETSLMKLIFCETILALVS
ncbi:hypothetical protein Tco_0330670, partial [Tanacetum coccineum]